MKDNAEEDFAKVVSALGEANVALDGQVAGVSVKNFCWKMFESLGFNFT